MKSHDLIDECRKQFESWASYAGYPLTTVDKGIFGKKYNTISTAAAWDAWKAAKGFDRTIPARPNKTCPRCNSPIKGHPNKKFCGSRCKDSYHNTHNPRGYGLKSREWEDEFGEPCFVGVSDFDNTSCQNEE